MASQMAVTRKKTRMITKMKAIVCCSFRRYLRIAMSLFK
jgi:hypothetical protein